MAGFITEKKVRDILKKYNPNYLIMLGQKSNGKSTAVKCIAVRDAYEKGELFGYIRRYSNDLKRSSVNKYFKNVKGFDVSKLTKGEFNEIRLFVDELFFIKVERDEKGHETISNRRLCGYIFAVNDYEHYASLNYPNVKNLIFEEFITLKPYLDDEIVKLNHIISTIIRNNGGLLFMLANTISSLSPYFREFELTNISKQEVGTVDVYLKEDTTICVYLTAPCDDKESYNMFFGAGASMIKSGEWQSHKQRKLEHPFYEYRIIYTMVLEYDTHLFLMQFLRHESGSYIWFVSRKTTPIKKGTRLISDNLIESELCTIGLIPLNENETILFHYLKTGKIAYSDNLTGTEFKQALKLIQ